LRVLAAGLLCAIPVLPQATQGLIAGRVVNSQTGAGIGGASITWENSAISNTGATRCDDAGYYLVPLLPPGQYRLRASAADYQPQEAFDLEVRVAGRIEYDFRLRPLNDVWEAGQYRSVFLPGSKAVVTFYGPDVDTSHSVFLGSTSAVRGALESTQSQVIDPAQIRDLPLAGRDVYTILVTQPGVTADTTTARGLGLSVIGQRPSASNFLLDGVENNNYLVTGPAVSVSPEAVQEYRVSTANFTAEYGRTSGYIANAVTRAGGAQWHGLGYFYVLDDSLDANSFQLNTQGVGRLPLRESQPGFQAGGPVLRNRLFLSGALELFRSRGNGAPTTFSLPTRTLLDFTASNSLARKLLDQFPDMLLPVNKGLLSGTVTLQPPASIDRWLTLERADAILRGGAHHLFGRVAYSNLRRPDFIWYPDPAFVTPLTDKNWNVAVGLQSTLSPRLVNEFRFARSIDNLGWDRARPHIPTLVSGDGSLLPGSPALYGYRNRARGWEFLDNFTWAHGRHIFKAGASALLRSVDGQMTIGRDGLYAFDTLLDFALDRPTFFSTSVSRAALPALAVPAFDRTYENRQFAFFAQDTFRVTRRFVLDFGVRYEHYGAPRNTGDSPDLTVALGSGGDFNSRLAGAQLALPGGSGGQQLYAADDRGWAGRFGFSYALVPGGRSLVRGSYGIFYDRPFDNLWQNLRANNLVLPVFLVPSFPANYLAPIAGVLPAYRDQPVDISFPWVTMFRGDLRNPYAQNWFLGIQQQIKQSWALEANTVGSLGRRLLTTDVVNRTAVNPDLPYINYRANQGFSDYYGLAVSLRNRTSWGQFHLAYTWSHAIDNQSEPLAGDFFDLSFSRVTAGGGRPVVAAFQREFDSNGDRGNSDFDQRQNLVFYSLWNLPAPRWSLHGLLRNWQFAQMAAFRSGFPYTVFIPSSSAADGQVYLNRRAGITRPAVTADSSVPGGKLLLDPAAFVDPSSGLPGNTGRNAFRGPGLFNVDLSLGRVVAFPKLGESGRLTFRADIFNFLNHANLNNPSPFFGSPGFGVGLYGRTGLDPGFPALTPFNETARQIQLLLRVEF
jgi:hypothetical protein